MRWVGMERWWSGESWCELGRALGWSLVRWLGQGDKMRSLQHIGTYLECMPYFLGSCENFRPRTQYMSEGAQQVNVTLPTACVHPPAATRHL